MLVNVTHTLPSSSDIWAFVGFVESTSEYVGGITVGPLSNVVVAHQGALIDIPSDDNDMPGVLAHVIVGLALGNAETASQRIRGAPVAVEQSECTLTSQICDLLGKLGALITTIPQQPSVTDLQKLSDLRPKLVIASLQGEAQALPTKHPEIGSTRNLDDGS